MKTLWILLLTVFLCERSEAQLDINYNFNLELSEDSITHSRLEHSLKTFLAEAQNGKYSHDYVDSFHRKKYDFFFRKLAGIAKNNNPNFHKPTILKSYSADKLSYMVTVAFSGIKEGIPFIYQITELKMVPFENHYRFYCPFEERTANFNSKKIKNVTYYYSGSLNERRATEFARMKDSLSVMTNSPINELNYYCFQDLDELLKSYGFLYSARQCNFLCYDLGFTDNDGNSYMTGTNNENYIFGYIGDFFYHNLSNQKNMYKTFVYGISAYYGGYGLSYDDMEEMKKQFRDELQENPKMDFLAEFKKGRKSSINRHFSCYVMSAFLCEEVLENNSFNDLLTLAYSGAEGEMFFDHLDSILGINESEFHNTIVRLINE